MRWLKYIPFVFDVFNDVYTSSGTSLYSYTNPDTKQIRNTAEAASYWMDEMTVEGILFYLYMQKTVPVA
jgi:hypothetical protein